MDHPYLNIYFDWPANSLVDGMIKLDMIIQQTSYCGIERLICFYNVMSS